MKKASLKSEAFFLPFVLITFDLKQEKVEMASTILKNARIVNESTITEGDLLIKDGRIERLDAIIDSDARQEIDVKGNFVIPGIIDDQG